MHVVLLQVLEKHDASLRSIWLSLYPWGSPSGSVCCSFSVYLVLTQELVWLFSKYVVFRIWLSLYLWHSPSGYVWFSFRNCGPRDVQNHFNCSNTFKQLMEKSLVCFRMFCTAHKSTAVSTKMCSEFWKRKGSRRTELSLPQEERQWTYGSLSEPQSAHTIPATPNMSKWA